MARIYIGNVRGPQGIQGGTGATGAPGANGADGAAATVSVGAVSTTEYGNPAQVTNSGTPSAAVLDFVIPQGQPGEEVTDMSGLTLGTMTTQTAQFPTPQIGDNGATLWGKVVKYFSDLRTLIGTKLNTANVVNNFTTTESGYALDARAGKTLNDNLTSKLGNTIYSVGSVAGNSSATLSVSSNARAYGFIVGPSINLSAVLVLGAYSDGSVYCHDICFSSNKSYSINTDTKNQLVLTNSTGASMSYLLTLLNYNYPIG